MRGFFIKWLANIVALMVVVTVIPGIDFDRWTTLIIAALALGLINAFLRPLIMVLTLPLHILSLGFFTLLVNGVLLYGVSKLIPGFQVNNLESAVWGGLVFSIMSFIFSLLISPQGKIEWRYSRHIPSEKSRYKEVIDVEGKVEAKTKK